jgi:hypothetical protein
MAAVAPAAGPARAGDGETGSQSARLRAALIDELLILTLTAGRSFAFSLILAKPLEDWVRISVFSYLGLRFVYE